MPAAASTAAPAAATPLTKDQVTFKLMVPSNSFVQDFSTNSFTKWYEVRTNVHINWQVVPDTEQASKFNVSLASGDLPDIYMSFRPSHSLQQVYGSQGVFIPLNDLIDKYGTYTKQMFTKYPEVRPAITAADGKIYGLIQLNDCYHCARSQKMWIYQPWLDQIGAKMPETTDDFAEALKAFKGKDPNGNGKADEIPLTSGKSWQTDLDLFLMNSFIFDPGGDRIIVKDGKVTAIYTQPEWRDGLRYFRSLFTAGLIQRELFTQSRDQLLRLTAQNPPVVGAVPAGAHGTFIALSKGGIWPSYVTVPPLKGPQGVRIGAYDPYFKILGGGGEFIITKSAKQPEIAFEWADGMYEREVTMRSIFGDLGTDWRWGKPGEVGTNGKPAIFWQNPETTNVPHNRAWRQTGPSYRPEELFDGNAIDTSQGPSEESILYNQTKDNYAPYSEDPKLKLPPLFLSTDAAKQDAQIAAQINPYVLQSMAQFVTGDLDIDKDWQKHLDTLAGMGLAQRLQLNQAAYDAMARG